MSFPAKPIDSRVEDSEARSGIPARTAGEDVRGPSRRLLPAAPAWVVAGLLLLATWFDGAFDLRYWALIAILVLAILVSALLAGGFRVDRGPYAYAVAAVWAFAAWSLLSATWADSPAGAWEGAARTTLYAALATIPAILPGRRQALQVGYLVFGGVAVVALVTLIQLYIDGADLYLAGRLNDPIGYRNGTAALFAICFWPLIGVAAERGRNAPLRGILFAAAVLALGLMFLTQSRGVAIGLAAGGIVLLVIGPDRMRRAWFAIAAFAMVAIASEGLLAPYRAFQDGEVDIDPQVDDATTVLTLLVLASFCVGLFAALLDNGLRSRVGIAARQGAAIGLAIVALAGVVGAIVTVGDPISYADDKWEEFTSETETSTGSSRIGSVGGQRYDLWRVAWEEFEDEPLAGVGEGSYDFGYYRLRRTDRNLSDPHSQPFRLLSETGIVGTLLYVAFLVFLAIAIARAARAANFVDRRVIAGLAAAGAAVVAQTLTDWLWVIPTVMGLGILALALAAQPRGRAEDRPAPLGLGGHGDRLRMVGRLAAAAAMTAAAVSVALLFLADLNVRQARAELEEGTAQGQLDAARRAEDLNPIAVTPLYLQASALESSGDRDAARDALREALEQEPDNFVTLALLGDLEIRAENLPDARGYYQRAYELNPMDVGLRELAEALGLGEDEEVGAEIPLTSATDFDPQGTGGEHPELTSLAIDSNPTGTAWSTESYTGGAFDKDGVGIYVATASAVVAEEVRLRLASPGSDVEVYAAPGAEEAPEEIEGWTRVGRASDLGTEATVRLEDHTPSSLYLVWLTELPIEEGGSDAVQEIRDIRLFSPLES
jgi:O-antigen ligase